MNPQSPYAMSRLFWPAYFRQGAALPVYEALHSNALFISEVIERDAKISMRSKQGDRQCAKEILERTFFLRERAEFRSMTQAKLDLSGKDQISKEERNLMISAGESTVQTYFIDELTQDTVDPGKARAFLNDYPLNLSEHNTITASLEHVLEEFLFSESGQRAVDLRLEMVRRAAGQSGKSIKDLRNAYPECLSDSGKVCGTAAAWEKAYQREMHRLGEMIFEGAVRAFDNKMAVMTVLVWRGVATYELLNRIFKKRLVNETEFSKLLAITREPLFRNRPRRGALEALGHLLEPLVQRPSVSAIGA
jgi:hypothetical protein